MRRSVIATSDSADGVGQWMSVPVEQNVVASCTHALEEENQIESARVLG
jgi:hypothetical protein